MQYIHAHCLIVHYALLRYMMELIVANLYFVFLFFMPNKINFNSTGTLVCCCKESEEKDEEASLQTCEPLRSNRRFIHPMDSRVGLTTHTPLFPPGKIIHVVRSHPKNVRLVGTLGQLNIYIAMQILLIKHCMRKSSRKNHKLRFKYFLKVY